MKSTINFGYLIFLSVVAALGGFLFGYDTAVISGTIAQVTQLFQLDTLQQGWYVGCALIGSIVGVLFAGILSDKLGRKMTMIISATLFSTSALGCAISADFTQLVVYRIIGGVGIGVVSIVSPLYISEVAVAQYRGRLVSLYQLAVTVGFLGAYLINYQLLAYAESGNQLSMDWLNKIFVTEVWRGMLGMETLPAVLFFIIIFFIPESPRWLIVRGKEEKAVNILERIYNSVSEAASQLKETKSEIDHLESIATSLDIALTEDDLVQIKEELVEYGYIKRKRTDKKAKIKSKPFHYISSDGYHMYVGKNNYQNEELTFKFATGNDWWFHAKGMPGSHVVVKTNNETDLPDRMFEEAGKLAGYYSSGRDSDKIEIDYLQKKNVKKPNGSAPGFVIYYTNFSLTVHPDISGLTLVE